MGTVDPEQLKFGTEYKIDSHLGGVFSIIYMGTNIDDEHLFIVTNPGWERTICWTDEQVGRLVLEA